MYFNVWLLNMADRQHFILFIYLFIWLGTSKQQLTSAIIFVVTTKAFD
jgi:hypothetical protein